MQGLLPALSVKPAKKLCWTGKATDLVELLYALDTCDCINDGEIGVEELADVLSEIFGVEIKNGKSKGRYSGISEYLPSFIL